jgi:hypothetical protein
LILMDSYIIYIVYIQMHLYLGSAVDLCVL